MRAAQQDRSAPSSKPTPSLSPRETGTAPWRFLSIPSQAPRALSRGTTAATESARHVVDGRMFSNGHQNQWRQGNNTRAAPRCACTGSAPLCTICGPRTDTTFGALEPSAAPRGPDMSEKKTTCGRGAQQVSYCCATTSWASPRTRSSAARPRAACPTSCCS